MNFLFYAPQMAPYGGMERHICGLANALAARGHHVELLTTSNSLGRELRDGLLTHGVLLHELPIDRGHARHRSAAFRKAWWLLQKSLSLRRTTWDVIYTNGQSALSRLVWIAGRARTRIVHHHHTAADEDEQGSWSPIFRHVIGRAREIVACSRATQAALETALHRHDVSFLPYLTSAAMPADRVEEISYDAEQPLHFAFMGRLVPEKGIDAILALSRRASLADIRWHIHGAGAGYDEELFRNYPNVVYHGPFAGMGAMGPALRTTDALVLFSLHNEGMPLSLIEGMSAGLPWIATDRGGTREIALSSANCLLVSNGHDLDSLARAAREMARRLRAGETSRREQRRLYDQVFSPQAVTAAWAAFLERTESPRPLATPLTANEIG